MNRPTLTLISAREVTELTTLSRSSIWREVKANRFPQPVSISPSRFAWPLAEVQAWLSDRVSARPDRLAA